MQRLREKGLDGAQFGPVFAVSERLRRFLRLFQEEFHGRRDEADLRLSLIHILPLLTALVYAPLYLLRTGDWHGTIALALIFPAMLWAHRSNFARWREGKEQTFRQFLFGRHEPQREEAGK